MYGQFCQILAVICFIKAGTAMKCYQCTSMNGDCTNGQCEGVWCVEQMVRGSGKVMVKKDCSPANNLANGREECLKSSLDGAETVNCVCNSQDLCNSADYLRKFPAYITTDSPSGPPSPVQNLPTTGGQTNPNTPGNTVGNLPGISCYQCANQTGDCTYGHCTGSWCLATVIKKDDGTIGVTKDCFRDTILTKTRDDCISQQLSPGYTSHTCTCRTSEMCNSKEYLDTIYSQQNGGNLLFSSNANPTTGGFNNTSRTWVNSGTPANGLQAGANRVRCYCSADLHGKAQCEVGNTCYGEACVFFNGSVHEMSSNRTSPLSFHSCELSVKNLQQGPNLHFPYCETTNYMDDTVNGHVQITGQSCYCNSEGCNNPQNTRNNFKPTGNNNVNDPSWQQQTNTDWTPDRSDRLTPLSQGNTPAVQPHQANNFGIINTRLNVVLLTFAPLLLLVGRIAH